MHHKEKQMKGGGNHQNRYAFGAREKNGARRMTRTNSLAGVHLAGTSIPGRLWNQSNFSCRLGEARRRVTQKVLSAYHQLDSTKTWTKAHAASSHHRTFGEGLTFCALSRSPFGAINPSANDQPKSNGRDDIASPHHRLHR